MNKPEMISDKEIFSSSQEEEEFKKTVSNLVGMRTKSKNKLLANSSKNHNNPESNLEIVAECENSSCSIKNKCTEDKDVTASSSNIDLFNILSGEEVPTERFDDNSIPTETPLKTRDARPPSRDKTPSRREKHPRQHRVKVRSPKRRLPIHDQRTSDDIRRSIGITAVDWDQEEEVLVDNVINVQNTNEEQPSRESNDSMGDMCRICHSGEALSNELGQLISACSCRGTVGRVHVKCLERWLTESGKSRCELCGIRYVTKRVHRYGVPRALIMWVLSQNAKQLMVDSLGIMLMSPLAVLAAWLTGRTLAGLMTQDSQVTPWPLASTFVLACMTLVCYYCWIVSAATRHALGWWIWYRSQYEVRLQFQETEE